MSETLNPCPFCGGDPRPLLLTQVSASMVVVCNRCGAHGPLDDDEPAAIAAWNRRPATSPQERLGE